MEDHGCGAMTPVLLFAYQDDKTVELEYQIGSRRITGHVQRYPRGRWAAACSVTVRIDEEQSHCTHESYHGTDRDGLATWLTSTLRRLL